MDCLVQTRLDYFKKRVEVLEEIVELKTEELWKVAEDKDAEIEKLEEIIEEKDVKIGELYNTIDIRDAEKLNLLTIFRERGIKVDKLVAIVKEKDILIKNLEDDWKALGSMIDDRDETIEQLIVKIKEKDVEIENSKKEMVVVRQYTAALKENADLLQKKQDSLDKELMRFENIELQKNKRLFKELFEVGNKLYMARKQIGVLQEEIKRLEEQLK